MRFIHLGDLHIGKSLGDFDLIKDQRFILDQITDIAVESKADAVLIAGDIYDRPIPSEGAVHLFDYFINRLVANNIRIFAVTGNHDSDERLNFGTGLFETNQVYICARFDGRIRKYVEEDEFGKINIYLMPFIKASQVRHYYPEENIDTYDQAVRVAIEKSDIDPSERNILVAHQFVSDSAGKTELSGSEGIATQSVGLVEVISADCFSMFDYVALGHIHAPQSVGRDEIRYSGSPLKYSLSESGRDKSVPVVTAGPKGQVDIQLEKLHPDRDLRHIRGKLKDLLDPAAITGENDFIYATLTDEDVINDAMSIFQQYYRNTVRIDYDNSHTREISAGEIISAVDERSFDELISDFYRQMYGTEITEEELEIMREVAGKAGVANEAG